MTTVNKPHYQASWRSVVLLIVFCAVIVLIPIGAAVIAKKNSYQQYASEYQRIDTSDIDSEEAGYGDPADMSGYRFLSKGGGAGFLLESPETACNVIESGTALIYIGSDSCQWCQRAVPVLDTVSNDEHFAILYVDASKISQDQIKSLEEELYDYLKTDKDGNKVLYTPMVVGVRKGKIVGTHIGTVDSFEIKDKNSNLNHKQYQELYGIYDDIVKLVKAKD